MFPNYLTNIIVFLEDSNQIRAIRLREVSRDWMPRRAAMAASTPADWWQDAFRFGVLR
jgi:hypothetical protein